MYWMLRAITSFTRLAGRLLPSSAPEHLRVGNKGETEAYLFLRRSGYRIVTTNFRVPDHHAEIDIIAWHRGVLCFVEVKSRTGGGIAPPEAAVDAAKRQHIRAIARRYLRQLAAPQSPACRFDIVSVSFSDSQSKPTLRLIKGAFRWHPRSRLFS